MATAYCMLANGGKEVRATLIDRIQDRWGRSVWKHDARECVGCAAETFDGQSEPEIPDDRKQIIDPHSAYQMTSILEGVVQRGTATVLKSLNRPVAGKTGTTNEERDAWFVGYTPDMVVGVYVGFDTPRPMGKGRTGGGVAAPIFGEFMKRALADEPAAPFRVPPGLKLVRVNLKTGLRAEPGSTQAILEAFKPTEEPDDAYSIIGFQVSDTGTSPGSATEDTVGGGYSPQSDAWTPTSTPPGNAPAPPPPRPPGW
jgi:penicillin-binding protein 1A